MAEVLCPICGRPNSDHREFCDFCGNPLDGALRVESDPNSADDDLLGNRLSDPMDDASRLDSLVPAPEKEMQPAQQDRIERDEPLNGDSRLESLLAAEEDQSDQQSQADPTFSDQFNGGSRLDDYLPAEDAEGDQKPKDFEQDDSSRLDEYLSPEEPEQGFSLGEESLSANQEDESYRLDDYLAPESTAEEQEPDEAARLDDFFADDPFQSSDPFQEPVTSKPEGQDLLSYDLDSFREAPEPESASTPADQAPSEDPLFSTDDLWADFPSEQPRGEPEPREDLGLSGSSEPDDWDYRELTEASEAGVEGEPPEAIDPGEWDILESGPGPEQTEGQKPLESIDAGEWDYLDPSPAQEGTEEEKTPEAIDPGEWDYLDPSPAQEGTGEEKPPESTDVEEWDFLDPAPAPDSLDSVSSPDPSQREEWDFLDPASAETGQEAVPRQESAESEQIEDWGFLDPGPTADLEEAEDERAALPADDEEDAGWLDMLQDPASRKQPAPEVESSSEPQIQQTDWLEKIKRLNKSSDLVDEDSSFPDWLSVTGKTAEFKTEDQSEDSSDEVPDWLQLDDDDESLDEFLRKKDLSNEEYKPKVTTDSLDEPEIPADSKLPRSDLSDSQQIKFPSWADEQKQKKSEKAQTGAGKKERLAESLEPFQIEEEFIDDLFSEELPSWLTEASSDEIRESLSDALAQGELPGWVEAMRPVVESTDASGLDEDEEYIENYGPLAGIPSVLPAEAEIGIDFDQAVKKPLDLQATKSHKDYVDLLKRLIGEENKSKTIQLPSPLQTQRVLRWLIAIVMLVAVAGTLIFSGSFEMETPTAAQIEGTGFGALYEEIETLYDGQPVLIAFDYQPAAAGELHTAAATVVDHLMEEGTFLSFISTQPTGPALAEHFLDTTQSHHEYIHTQKYINLGYLPGESAGLLSFMISPEKIIPLAFDGSNAWDSPPLISINGINDFKMIMVITDDPNTAKIWIEQVGSRLEDTPLTMVVSAQVEPLIQPYFRTSPRLLDGYVAGIIDSINYEKLTERPFLANKVWLPFNVGIVISVGVIFISGLANGVLSLFSRRKQETIGDSK